MMASLVFGLFPIGFGLVLIIGTFKFGKYPPDLISEAINVVAVFMIGPASILFGLAILIGEMVA